MHYWYILLYLILPRNGNANNLVCKKMQKDLQQTMFNQQCNKSLIVFKEQNGTKSMSGEKGTKGEKGITGEPGEVNPYLPRLFFSVDYLRGGPRRTLSLHLQYS